MKLKKIIHLLNLLIQMIIDVIVIY